jgi:hypothetical protein
MLVDGEIDGTWLALLLCAYARLCVWELELILRPSSLSHCRIHVLRCSFSEYIKNLDFVRGHVGTKTRRTRLLLLKDTVSIGSVLGQTNKRVLLSLCLRRSSAKGRHRKQWNSAKDNKYLSHGLFFCHNRKSLDIVSEGQYLTIVTCPPHKIGVL